MQIRYTKAFKKSFKKLSDKDKNIFFEVVEKLINNQVLEAKYKDHALVGNYAGCRECHLKPDLLLKPLPLFV